MSLSYGLTQEQLDSFDHVPRPLLGRVRLVTVPFLSRGSDAMTLRSLILVRRGHEDSQRLLAHELVHVEQWDRLGVVRFLVRYLGSYFKNLARVRRHRPAYLAIPMEAEARERARQWQERHGG